MNTLLISIIIIGSSLGIYYLLFRSFDKRRQERFKTSTPSKNNRRGNSEDNTSDDRTQVKL